MFAATVGNDLSLTGSFSVTALGTAHAEGSEKIGGHYWSEWGE